MLRCDLQVNLFSEGCATLSLPEAMSQTALWCCMLREL